jgi:hypothetical protein
MSLVNAHRVARALEQFSTLQILKSEHGTEGFAPGTPARLARSALASWSFGQLYGVSFWGMAAYFSVCGTETPSPFTVQL